MEIQRQMTGFTMLEMTYFSDGIYYYTVNEGEGLTADRAIEEGNTIRLYCSNKTSRAYAADGGVNE